MATTDQTSQIRGMLSDIYSRANYQTKYLENWVQYVNKVGIDKGLEELNRVHPEMDVSGYRAALPAITGQLGVSTGAPAVQQPTVVSDYGQERKTRNMLHNILSRANYSTYGNERFNDWVRYVGDMGIDKGLEDLNKAMPKTDISSYRIPVQTQPQLQPQPQLQIQSLPQIQQPMSNQQYIQRQIPVQTQPMVFGMPKQDVQSFIMSQAPGSRPLAQGPMINPTAARQQLESIYQQYTRPPAEPVLPGVDPVTPSVEPQQSFREGGAVKKFADGGSASGSPSSGVRRLKMSGYEEGGEVTDDAFIQEMMTGTLPTDQGPSFREPSDGISYKQPKSQELANQIRALFEQLETPSPSSEEEYLKRRPTPESREPIRSRKAMEALLLAANPRMEIEERPLPGGKFGFVRADDPDTLVLSTRQFPAQREETAFHELEHSLAMRGGNPLGKLTREGKPITMDNNYRFDVLYNRDGKTGGDGRYARYDIIKRMIDNKDKIEKFFGRPIDSNYFSREPEGGLLAEQFADLSALEQVTNKSLTRDPEMRKLLFPDDKAAAVYDAITGLRQTRLDAKDRPPYTPDYPEEKGIMDWIRGKLGMGEK